MISKIVFDCVSLSYGEKNLFDNVSINLNAGNITSIVGVNGSGKSSFLKLAGQFIKPTSGKVTAFDSDIAVERVELSKRTAAVAPSMNLYSELTAIENITFFAGLRDIDLKHSDIDILFKRVGLNLDDKSKLISGYSTGMIQRLKFAILLAVEADVWLLDEPGSNLDETGRAMILNEVKRAASEGKLILMATNDRDEAEAGNETISLPIG